MRELNLITLVSLIIVLVGGINLGLLGLFDINIILAIFGVLLTRLIYIIMGVAAGYLIYQLYLEKMKKKVNLP